MKKKLLIVLCISTAVFVAGLILLRGMTGKTPPEVFSMHETEIRQYIANVQLGKIPRSADGQGFLVLQVLDDNGATHVEQKGNCVVVTFGFMPTDVVPQLWYSPVGFSPMPAPIQELKAQHKFFRWHQLQNDWGYCEWDD
jgi:hypothetical protein